jgi:hypothetical protein
LLVMSIVKGVTDRCLELQGGKIAGLFRHALKAFALLLCCYCCCFIAAHYGQSIYCSKRGSQPPISNFTRLLQLKPKVHVECNVLDVVETFYVMLAFYNDLS